MPECTEDCQDLVDNLGNLGNLVLVGVNKLPVLRFQFSLDLPIHLLVPACAMHLPVQALQTVRRQTGRERSMAALLGLTPQFIVVTIEASTPRMNSGANPNKRSDYLYAKLQTLTSIMP